MFNRNFFARGAVLTLFILAPSLLRGQGSPNILWQQQRNSDRINACVFAPDGNTFITGSSDRLINFWRASDGTLLKTFNSGAAYVHASSIESLAITLDGSRLASTAYKVAKLWTVASGAVMVLNGHTDWVVGCAFRPGGANLATASFDKTVKIWRVSDGVLVRTLTGHSGQVRCVAFSPDGNYLASGSGDTTIRIWRTSDWAVVRILYGHTSDIYDLTWSPDSTKIASGAYDMTCKLWNVSNGTVLGTFDSYPGNVYAVGFSPDGGTLAFSGGEANNIKLVNVASASVFRTFTDNVNNVQCLAFSPLSNALLGYGRADATVLFGDVSSSAPPPTVQTPTISPAGGTFTNSASVTLACGTTGATIYYTVDGSDPIAGSTVYSGPFLLSSNATVKAKATAGGMNDSAIAAAGFSIVPSTTAAATPSISPNGGTYSPAVTVTLAGATPGSTIYYTLDGSVPTVSSPIYTASFSLNASATVKAKAVASGYSDSAIASASFSIGVPVGTVQATAVFVKTDTTQQGTWKGVYGSEGYTIVANVTNYPGYAQTTPVGCTQFVWIDPTFSGVGLQKADSTTARLAACWNSSSGFGIYLNFTDGKTHRVGVYCVDWDSQSVAQTIDILDASSGLMLNSQAVSSFTLGKYLVWDVSGYVILRFTRTSGPNAVVSGLFFDPTPEGPIRLQSLGYSMADGYRLRSSGNVGQQFVLQASTNFVAWTPVSTNTLTSTTLEMTNSVGTGMSKRFYRALRLP